MAKISDRYYRYVAGNKPQIFWQQFDKLVYISEPLKDLIIGMIQLDVNARLTIDEILCHPWLTQGPIPT